MTVPALTVFEMMRSTGVVVFGVQVRAQIMRDPFTVLKTLNKKIRKVKEVQMKSMKSK
jgi:hypothetical protein